MNKLVGDVSEGLPGAGGFTSAVSFEMCNQGRGWGKENRQVICGKENNIY